MRRPATRVASPGLNDLVIGLLLDGYNVHVWDDGHDLFGPNEADKWGEGPALDEIADAITDRGVTAIALLGYSHGGGTVFNMSQRLYYDGTTVNLYGETRYFWDRLDDSKNWDLVYTSYIDAIRNSGYLDRHSEDRRPLGTEYHVNQYQRNPRWSSVWVHGAPSNGDIDIDRSGLIYEGDLVHHKTIDNHPEVHRLIVRTFKEHVPR